MKRILILLLCCSIFSAKATVLVSGTISSNTTWTKTNSPYIVNGNLSVDSGKILTIEPGVEVRVDSGYSITIDGSLIAQGTVTDTIKFTSTKTAPSHKAWQGITFTIKATKDTSRIKYCLFEYGSQPIRNVNANIYINNSVFRYNTTAITVFGAPSNVYPYSNYASFIIINKCLVMANDTGIYDTGYRYWGINSSVTENEISYNNIGLRSESEAGLDFTYNNLNYNSIGYWVYANGQRGSRYNTFKGNSMYAIYVTAATYDPLNNDVDRIYQNTFIYNAMAVYIENGFVFHFYNNTFSYNDTCIEFNYSMSLNSQYATGTHGMNCFSNTTSYNLINNSTKNINMIYSWWGKSSTSGIDSTIYDNKDNSSLGTINYSGYSTTPGCATIAPPPPCLQPTSLIVTTTSSTTATATWNKVTGAPAYEYYIIPLSATAPSSGTITFDTTINLTGLTTGQKYQVCVRTRCEASPFYSAWICDTLTMPCYAPTNFIIYNVHMFNATASWDTVAGAIGYEYYIAVHPSTPSLGTVTTNHSIYITGLNPNTTYDFCVRTRCISSVSPWICDTFHTASTGINTITKDDDVQIYPNPSKGSFTISLNNNHAAITVFDITGRIVTSKQMENASETISINNAAKGVYTIRILTDGAVINKRIVIE